MTVILLMMITGMMSAVSSDQTMDTMMDSRMTFSEAIAGTRAPPDVVEALCLADVAYYSFDGKRHIGQLLIHRDLKPEILEIFQVIERLKFPVGQVIPIVRYAWSDRASMEGNNTSAFNYRLIAGKKTLSLHARGRAIDINPSLNPVIYRSGRISPRHATYDPQRPGTLDESHPIVREFLKRGWRWGGHFKTLKDYHHFDKPG